MILRVRLILIGATNYTAFCWTTEREVVDYIGVIT